MNPLPTHAVSGHVWLYPGKRRSTWYAKVRLPDGRQENRKIGPAWTEPRGRPPAGYFTKKTANAALQAILTDARRGTLPGLIKTGVTFKDAAIEWLRHGEVERGIKPSTRRDYKSAVNLHLIPAFGEMKIEDITTKTIDRWRARQVAEGKLPRRTANKLVAILHGVFERARDAYELEIKNPAAGVKRFPERYDASRYDFYAPEEVWALVRAADAEQDGAIYLTAAFTGLRLGELLALRVRDVDFEADSIRVMGSLDSREGIGTPKSGKGRTVPMVGAVAQALARLLQREHFTGSDDFLFTGETGHYLDGSALRRRYRAAQARAGLRPLRFHDLRHTFGSLAVRRVGAFDLQAYMGHADGRTTARYTHYRPRTDEARLLAGAFEVEPQGEDQTEPKRRRSANQP